MNISRFLIFTIVFCFFVTAPAFFSSAFPPYPLMKVGDILDLLTPLVLIPIYWGLYKRVSRGPLQPTAITAFIIFSALWVLGQGMHLAANSIGHQLELLKDTSAYTLTYFYDEILSHYLWHLGVFGLSALLMIIDWRSPMRTSDRRLAHLPAALIYGFTFFLIIIKGQTWPVGLPFAALSGLLPMLMMRDRLGAKPVLGGFSMAYMIALLLTIGWWIYWGEPVEFSAVGII